MRRREPATTADLMEMMRVPEGPTEFDPGPEELARRAREVRRDTIRETLDATAGRYAADIALRNLVQSEMRHGMRMHDRSLGGHRPRLKEEPSEPRVLTYVGPEEVPPANAYLFVGEHAVFGPPRRRRYYA